jgi:ankyrin repeat protein
MRVHFDCFDYLLSVGARVSVKDKEGLTPLYVAGTFMERGDDDTHKSRLRKLISRLMQKGAKLPKPNFIMKGGSLETQTSLRVTPLHTGVEMQDLDLIEYLLKQGGCLETWNAEGETPVHLAVRKVLIGPLNKMLRWQTPSHVVDVRDRSGRTPLHLAVMGQWSEGVSLLLEVGADVKALTSRNETVLHLAADRGNSTMMEELLSIPESSKVSY